MDPPRPANDAELRQQSTLRPCPASVNSVEEDEEKEEFLREEAEVMGRQSHHLRGAVQLLGRAVPPLTTIFSRSELLTGLGSAVELVTVTPLVNSPTLPATCT